MAAYRFKKKGVPLVGLQEELRGPSGYTIIYSQGLYFEPRAGGEVRIFGVYNNQQKYIGKPIPPKNGEIALQTPQIEVLRDG